MKIKTTSTPKARITPPVHVRTKKPLTKGQFHSIVVDMLQRKAYPNKQRILEEATRKMWHYLVPDKSKQPTKKVLSKKALDILDLVSAEKITASDLPIHKDHENEWRLDAGLTQRKPPTWQIDQIVDVVKEKNKPDHYVVKWANTVEPAAFIPDRLIKTFLRKRVEDAYIEAEAKCS